MFRTLHFETIGNCNRTCPTCIRNSHPDRLAVNSWFTNNLLEEDLVYQATEEAVGMGFRGSIILSHYNEPLMDKRLPRIAHKIRDYYSGDVFLHTNGDFLNEQLAAELDGALDHIQVTLYMDNEKAAKRAAWIKSLFKHTKANVNASNSSYNPHMTTHFSPLPNLSDLILEKQSLPCTLTNNVIINHRRQYLLCCDDVTGNFGLGTYPEISIKEYWSGKSAEIRATLANPGGRFSYDHCRICPK